MSVDKMIKYYSHENVAYKIICRNKSNWIGERDGFFNYHNVKIKKKICPLVYQTVFNVNYSLRIRESYIEKAIGEYFGEENGNGQSTT